MRATLPRMTHVPPARLATALSLAFSLALAGCPGTAPPADGGASPGVDAPAADVPGLDAPLPDAPLDDAPIVRTDAGPIDGGVPATVRDRARALAMHLSGTENFLVGMGNDLDGAPTYDPDRAGAFVLGPQLDLHYTYLVGLTSEGGWSTWNTDGSYVTIHAEAAARNGTAMMFSYYVLALDYETGGDTLTDSARMQEYLEDVRRMFQRLGAVGDPALAHFEPDLMGYLQVRMDDMSMTPDTYPARIRHASVPECMALPEVASSLLPCFAAMRDALAPEVRIAVQASSWGAWYDVTDPGADVEGSGTAIADFLLAMNADATDFVVVETLDRDAGFWETSGGMAGMCSITGGSRGVVYWDETNTTYPNFAQHFRWVGAITTRLGLPALWWQMPFGVPSTTCGGPAGGSDGHWRDNRVHYFFGHPSEAVLAGGFGMVFGTGAGRQTYVTTDGNQFRDAATAYVAAPEPL